MAKSAKNSNMTLKLALALFIIAGLLSIKFWFPPVARFFGDLLGKGMAAGAAHITESQTNAGRTNGTITKAPTE